MADQEEKGDRERKGGGRKKGGEKKMLHRNRTQDLSCGDSRRLLCCVHVLYRHIAIANLDCHELRVASLDAQ